MIQAANGIKNGNQGASTSARNTKPGKSDRKFNESQVTFLTAENLKLQGAITHITRQMAVCEIYGGIIGLRMSEVLNNFQLNVGGHIIYNGRAVISKLLDGGSNTLCEVTLDESSWSGLDLSALDKHSIIEEFKQFINDQQYVYKIHSDYKLVLTDMQIFLADLRLWLSQLELGLGATSQVDRPAWERAMIAEIGLTVFPIITALFEKFEMAAAKVDKQFLHVHQSLVKRMLHPLILCSPFMHRIYFKPLGYAGDYEMVNMILRDPHEGNSLFAKLLNVFILGQVPGEAHRNRVIYLVNRLVEETQRMIKLGEVCKIYNLGCGPAGEIQHFLRHHNAAQRAEFTLLDADEQTLRDTGAVLARIKSECYRRTPIKLVRKSVHQLLKPSDKIRNIGEKYDLIYSAGLYDYLTDQVGRIIIELLYEQLAPGGLLLITNVDPVNPIKNIMEHIYDWHLIYRNGDELRALASGLPADAMVSIRAEYTSANVILEMRKPMLPS